MKIICKKHLLLRMCGHASTLKLKGTILNMGGVDDKISNCIHYNCKVDESLAIYCIKARLPTNFT